MVTKAKVEILERVLKMDNGTLLPIPEGLSPEEAIEMYANQYPELTTAELGKEETSESKITFPVTKRVGTKG
jgi:PRTRC genetic system protein C